MNIQQLLRNRQGSIVDVRTPEEFRAAHVPGALNIPLQEVPARMEQLKHLKAPLSYCVVHRAIAAEWPNVFWPMRVSIA